MSSVSGTEIALPGFYAGLRTRYKISPRFFMGGRASYMEQNTKFKNDYGFEGLEVTYHYSWVTTHVQLNYILTPELRNKFFVGLGLSPQKLISANYNYVQNLFVGGGRGVITNDGSNYNQLNEYNLSSSSQVGIQIPLRQGGSILIAMSFERSLNNLLKRSQQSSPLFVYTYAPSDIRLNSFSIGVNYLY